MFFSRRESVDAQARTDGTKRASTIRPHACMANCAAGASTMGSTAIATNLQTSSVRHRPLIAPVMVTASRSPRSPQLPVKTSVYL